MSDLSSITHLSDTHPSAIGGASSISPLGSAIDEEMEDSFVRRDLSSLRRRQTPSLPRPPPASSRLPPSFHEESLDVSSISFEGDGEKEVRVPRSARRGRKGVLFGCEHFDVKLFAAIPQTVLPLLTDTGSTSDTLVFVYF